jgi:hypothetical protein
VSKLDIIPAYFDGQDRSKPAVFLKTRDEIKAARKAGTLHGSYQDNGKVFILYRAWSATPEPDQERLIAAGCMADAWKQIQSGYGGPMVLQMPSTERRASA